MGPGFELQVGGTTTELAPQLLGTVPFRAANAVKVEAKLHVKSKALEGVPLSLSYCSERPPFEGVYFRLMARKPSA